MKKAKEYYKDALLFCYEENNVGKRFKKLVLETIKKVQIDTIDETCKVCADNADADFTYLGDNLKKIEGEYIEVYVLKHSILDCAKILKKKL